VLLYDSNERNIVNDEAKVEQCIAHSETNFEMNESRMLMRMIKYENFL
jgi:hypothetical protein